MTQIHTHQFQTLLGTGYVQEHHADNEQPSLLVWENDRREIRFADLLKRLRSALGTRR